jgi:protein-S-isoprenylcysteine O-methyltransferase Ste14
MIAIFIICLALLLLELPVYYFSLNHDLLGKKFGNEKGRSIGDLLGRISGWGFFLFWFGVWVTPQPPVPVSLGEWDVSFLYFHTNWLFIIIGVPLFALSCCIGIKSVNEISLKTAETHRADKVITTGFYSRMRHPQYLAGLIAHIAFSVALSSFLSLIFFPLAVVVVWFFARWEEQGLIREFGETYREYKKKVSMFLPLKKKSTSSKRRKRGEES